MGKQLATDRKVEWKPLVEPSEYQGNLYDQVIDAYLDGYRKGSWEQRMIKEALQRNLNRAMHLSGQMKMDVASQMDIHIDKMFLKIEAQNSYDVALVLPLEVYYSDKKRKLTEYLLGIEDKNYDINFGLTFITIPHKETLNLKRLNADGYIFEHVEEQGAAAQSACAK